MVFLSRKVADEEGLVQRGWHGEDAQDAESYRGSCCCYRMLQDRADMVRFVQLRSRPSPATLPPCPGCFPTSARGLYSWSNATPRRPLAPRRLDSVALFRSFSSDRAPPSPAPPPPMPSTPEDDAHKLAASAAKATQQFSSPEGVHHEPVDVSKVAEVTEKEQSRRDWEIIRKLVPNIWPKDDWGTKTRVMLAVGLLVGGKVS